MIEIRIIHQIYTRIYFIENGEYHKKKKETRNLLRSYSIN